MTKRIILIFFCLALTSGCASVDYINEVSPRFDELQPSIVAVMPVMNETVDLDAPKPFIKHLRTALGRSGYRLVDQELIERKIVEEEGIHLAEEVRSIPDRELGEMLGADALLFTTVTSWETLYVGVYASITVAARFQLVDAKTSETLWLLEDEEKDISIAVDKKTAQQTAAFAALQSYEPYVERLVKRSIVKLPQGIDFHKKVLPKRPPDEGCCCFGP